MSFGITYYAIPPIIKIAFVKNLYDIPDLRKVHLKPKASFGGMAMFLGILLSVLLVLPAKEASQFQYLFAAMIILFFLGIKDDIIGMSPYKKFAGQAIAAFIVVFPGEMGFSHFQGFLNIEAVHPLIGSSISFISLLLLINAFNLIDGVDGLAAMLGIVSLSFLGSYFVITGNLPFALLAFVSAASIFAFLLFNFYPSKIFMGDTGSMLIGLLVGVLLFKFLDTAPGAGLIAAHATPALALSLVSVPLLDLCQVFGRRLLKRQSPFRPDKTHVHHRLLATGMNHKDVTIALSCVTVFFPVLVYCFQHLSPNKLIFGIIGCYFVGMQLFWSLAGPNKFENYSPTSSRGSRMKFLFRLWLPKKRVAE
jgi:UDP-N-acetylmuramyl pentapeptide phosphotransferase/UDP-N-acetylglucosamine-1-phosphate transferase